MYIYGMNKWILIPLLVLLFSCNNEQKEEGRDSGFFPVLSYLNSQVAQVDTSLYRIVKITTVDEQSDTTYIKREDFRKEAADFLSIPDITQKKLKKDYKETELYDESLQSVILSYMPTEDDAEIRRQEVVIQPHQAETDQVTSIYIDRVMEQGKATVRKNMLWQVDRRFQVVTITQNSDGTEKIEKRQVIWNDHPSAE
jgi:hypothetical protein